MDYLIALISEWLDDPDQIQWVIYGVAGLAGIMFAMAIAFLISGIYSPLRKQLQNINNENAGSPEADVLSTLEHSLNRHPKKPFIDLSNDETRRLLIHAGLQSENALAIFSAIRLILLLLSAGISIILVNFIPDLSTLLSLYLVALLVGAAFLLPSFTLEYLASRRMRMLRVGFPDALDLLVVCCEAGLGLLAALQRVARELSLSHTVLASELELVCSKVRAGLPIKVALQEFTDRTGLEDTKGLNSAISQSIRLGTGIAETLRVFSDEYRNKRLQEAEEKAAKLAVKMIFPMMFCIWPSFFIVAVGPAILKVMKVWGQAF